MACPQSKEKLTLQHQQHPESSKHEEDGFGQPLTASHLNRNSTPGGAHVSPEALLLPQQVWRGWK